MNGYQFSIDSAGNTTDFTSYYLQRVGGAPQLDPQPFYPFPFPMDFGLTLDSFQTSCYSTAIYPDGAKTIYPILGLIGEAGEVAEKTRDYLFPKGCPKEWDEVAMFLKQVYLALDNAAKAGLSAGKTSKVVRDKNKQLNPACIEALKARVDALTDEQKESLGIENMDCAWFIATNLGDMGFTFGEYGQKLLDKLQKRKDEGKIGGDGDNR